MNFARIFRSPAMGSVVGALVLVVLASVVKTFFVGPVLESRNRRADLLIIESPVYAGPPTPVSGWAFSVPRVIHESETKRFSITLSAGHLNGQPTVANEVTERVALEIAVSPELQARPPDNQIVKEFEGSFVLTWHWLLTPDQPGNYTILVDGLVGLSPGDLFLASSPDSNVYGIVEWLSGEAKGTAGDRSRTLTESRGLQERPSSDDYSVIGEGAIQFHVTALTPLGLTAEQSALLDLARLFILVIGAILGYPIWKSLFSPRPNRNADAPKQTQQPKDSAPENSATA